MHMCLMAVEGLWFLTYARCLPSIINHVLMITCFLKSDNIWMFLLGKSMELYSSFWMFTPFYFYWVLISILIYFLSIIFYCEMTEFSKKYDPRMPIFAALQKYLLLDFYYLHLARIIRYFSPPEDSFVL